MASCERTAIRDSAAMQKADGIVWERPELGLHEFAGSKANNIVLTSETMNGLAIDAGHPAVFKDQNPDIPANARYKAIIRSREKNGLIVLASANGIHWKPHFNHLVLRLREPSTPRISPSGIQPSMPIEPTGEHLLRAS